MPGADVGTNAGVLICTEVAAGATAGMPVAKAAAVPKGATCADGCAAATPTTGLGPATVHVVVAADGC